MQKVTQFWQKHQEEESTSDEGSVEADDFTVWASNRSNNNTSTTPPPPPPPHSKAQRVNPPTQPKRTSQDTRQAWKMNLLLHRIEEGQQTRDIPPPPTLQGQPNQHQGHPPVPNYNQASLVQAQPTPPPYQAAPPPRPPTNQTPAQAVLWRGQYQITPSNHQQSSHYLHPKGFWVSRNYRGRNPKPQQHIRRNYYNYNQPPLPPPTYYGQPYPAYQQHQIHPPTQPFPTYYY